MTQLSTFYVGKPRPKSILRSIILFPFFPLKQLPINHGFYRGIDNEKSSDYKVRDLLANQI